MKNKTSKRYSGLTLVEIIVAAVVIIVAILGAIAYRYHCVLDARKADVQITAARVGLMLLDGWKGMGGRLSTDPGNIYDPTDFSFGGSEMKVAVETGPEAPAGYNTFGSYIVVVDGAYYYTTLSFMDEPAKDLRILHISVSWPEEYPTGSFSEDSKKVYMSTKVNLPG